MSKRRKNKGLLSGQKPKRRWPLWARVGKVGLFILVSALCLSSYLWLQKHSITKLISSRPGERPQLVASPQLSEEDQARIAQAYRQLPEINSGTLIKFAQDLHQTMGLRSITLIQTSPTRIAVASEPFIASLIVELDRWRYVTADGLVFGQINENEVPTLPVLKGLDRKLALPKSPNGTFVPSPGNQRIIDETLLAIREGKRYNIQYRSLAYDDFRGLMGELQEASYRVTLGFKPFESKYLRLEKILASLKQRGITSATIGLDYKGKAFVKESVL